MSDKHDLTYYLKCMMGGVLACGVTHAGITPLDVVKCRKQVLCNDFSSTFTNLRNMNNSCLETCSLYHL